MRPKKRIVETKILFFNTMCGQPFDLDETDLPSGFKLTTDKWCFNQADAVVFHIPNLYWINNLQKRPGQIWIAWSMECDINYSNLCNQKFMNHNSQSIGFVGAEPYLIHGTILENLTYGISRKYLDDKIWQVLRIVRLDEFVKELPDGLGHIIQENGEGLSSGQKQRITIARAFLRKPPY